MYEFDFLQVGNGEKSGDAIALRYTTELGTTVHVVDGGTEQAGKNLCEHISSYYRSPPLIDHLVCTHIDDDHTRGLLEVIDTCELGQIWINRPWLYAEELLEDFDDGRMTVDSLRRELRERYPNVAAIEDKAFARRIPISSAFKGQQIGQFRVLAPTKRRYLGLVPHFSRTPEAAPELLNLEAAGRYLKEAKRKAITWIQEDWETDNLRENVETSATNESSLVQFAEIDGHRILLTGDAGIGTLTQAADTLKELGFDLPVQFTRVQIPHHGGRHNVAPSILNRLFGNPVPPGTAPSWSAIFSASKEDTDHPKQSVINAFRKRGGRVVGTNGSDLHSHYNAPARDGWVSATEYDFVPQSEEWNES